MGLLNTSTLLCAQNFEMQSAYPGTMDEKGTYIKDQLFFHLMEHPMALVDCTGTSLFADSASTASFT
jgi:hypothetical protein